MSKMKIYLQRPWKNSDSIYYVYLREQSPKSVNYVNANEFKLIQSEKEFKHNNFLKKNVKNLLKLFPYMPNAHRTRFIGDYDLIHCAHCLSSNEEPWVADFEMINQLWACQNVNEKKFKIKKLLESEFCKKIMPWTEWCKEEILEMFPEINDKIEVVYPAIPEKRLDLLRNDKGKDDINLFFYARNFFAKNGKDAIETMDKLTREYENVTGAIVSDVPDGILNKYSRNKKMTFHRLMSQEKLFELCGKADVFVYPSRFDPFGFGIIEAFSFGLPVVSCEGQSRKELIGDGKTGYVVSEREDLIKMTEKLIVDEKLRKRMSKNCVKEIRDGKFSVKRRNEKLKRIYEEALVYPSRKSEKAISRYSEDLLKGLKNNKSERLKRK